MLGSVGAAAVGLLAVASSLHGALAVNCTFALGTCRANPCPNSVLDNWGVCILANVTTPATCPEGCILLENSDGADPPGICALPSAANMPLTTAQIAQIRDCVDAPSVECVTSGLTLLDATGCEDCVTDLLEVQARDPLCSGITGGQAACEAVDTPCEGEPPAGAAPLAAGMAPAPGPLDALEPAAVAPVDSIGAPEPATDAGRLPTQGPTTTPTVGGASDTQAPQPPPQPESAPSGAAGLAGACAAALGAVVAAIAL